MHASASPDASALNNLHPTPEISKKQRREGPTDTPESPSYTYTVNSRPPVPHAQNPSISLQNPHTRGAKTSGNDSKLRKINLAGTQVPGDNAYKNKRRRDDSTSTSSRGLRALSREESTGETQTHMQNESTENVLEPGVS